MAQIIDIAYYLPSEILDNQQLEKLFPEWDADKISEKVGIQQRHIAANDETAVDMGIRAAEKLFQKNDRSKIDFILFCTQSPDYFLPTSACLIQNQLGLRKNIGALDFNLGCSGYIYGLALAKGIIGSKIAQNVLLITSETYSKHIHPQDKANRSIFGDGAAATLVSASEYEMIHEFELGTDGAGMNNLIVPNGGLRSKFDSEVKDELADGTFLRNNNFLYMNGPEIFNFTIANIPKVVKQTLEKNNLSIDTIDYVIFHQANKFMLDYLQKKIKIAPEKFYQEMNKTGNTVSSTIPIALCDCIDNGNVKKGNKILLCGFGVGYSWGATVIEL